MASVLEESLILRPEVLHILHTHLSENEVDEKASSAVVQSLVKRLFGREDPILLCARGSILHIRRVSRNTTFVDISLQPSESSCRQLSIIGSLVDECKTKKSPLRKYPSTSDSNFDRTCGVRKVQRKEEEAHFGDLDGASECAQCVRIELLVSGEVLASLSQKLRIGSLVECKGEHLENLAEGRKCNEQGLGSAEPVVNDSRTVKANEVGLENEFRIDIRAGERSPDGLGTGAPAGTHLVNSKLKDSAHQHLVKKTKQLTTVQSEALSKSEVAAKEKARKSLLLEEKIHSPKEGQLNIRQSLLNVDWMLKVSSLTVSDPRGSTTGNVLLDKSLAVKGELPTHCFGGRKSLVKDGVCKFWVNEGRCVRGADCAYEHPPHGAELKKARAAYLEAKAKAHHSSGNAGKAKRVQVFGDWICKTFDRGSKSLRVMDVAAGAHGEIAFHLAEKGIFCTSVEPRERKLTKAQRKALAQKGVVLPKDSTTTALPESLVGAQRRELFENSGYWTEIVKREATLLVGLHPDEVTESIVDLALRANVPFAVVPCCVFPKMFPNRRIGDRPVISYEDFLGYLQSKGKEYGKKVEKETLRFAGSNVVVFTRT